MSITVQNILSAREREQIAIVTLLAALSPDKFIETMKLDTHEGIVTFLETIIEADKVNPDPARRPMVIGILQTVVELKSLKGQVLAASAELKRVTDLQADILPGESFTVSDLKAQVRRLEHQVLQAKPSVDRQTSEWHAQLNELRAENVKLAAKNATLASDLANRDSVNAELAAERDQHKGELKRCEELVAKMHAAAHGGAVVGPTRGVVEDIEDLYACHRSAVDRLDGAVVEYRGVYDKLRAAESSVDELSDYVRPAILAAMAALCVDGDDLPPWVRDEARERLIEAANMLPEADLDVGDGG